MVVLASCCISFSCVIGIACTCPDQLTHMAYFVNLIAFMESSENKLCSLVSTLMFSDILLSTSALPWARQSEPPEALAGHNSVVSLLSFVSQQSLPVVVNLSVGVGSISLMSSDVPKL